jgi:hypothetical protein
MGRKLVYALFFVPLGTKPVCVLLYNSLIINYL